MIKSKELLDAHFVILCSRYTIQQVRSIWDQKKSWPEHLIETASLIEEGAFRPVIH